MEAVSKSIGRLDDLYALTQVTGGAFRRLGQVVSGVEVQPGLGPRTYSLSEGRLATQAAVGAAADVLDSLYAIRDKIAIADGLAVPSQRTDASRYSLQTDIATLTGAIDKAVARAGVGGLNLAAPADTSVRIQTTSLGGAVTVASQPLDSRSLGVAGLSVADQGATEAARRAVEQAIEQVSIRYDALAGAAQALRYDDGFSPTLAQALSGLAAPSPATGGYGGSAAPGRGALVNLRA